MNYRGKIEKFSKNYVARWSIILIIAGSIGTTAGWVSGVHTWFNGKVDNYIEIQKEGVINNADSLIKRAIKEEKDYYEEVINKNEEVKKAIESVLIKQGKKVDILTDAMLGELERRDEGSFNLWVSDTGKNYYENDGDLHSAWYESNRGRWMYRDYKGVVHKCK